MCSVSIVAADSGVRLVCNRDERLARTAAQPPALHRTGAGIAVYPTDPQSGGTWIGIADRGFAAVLLNRTPPRANPRPATTSRGAIVPFMLERDSFAEAIHAATRIDGDCFDPFMLILLNPSRTVAITSGGAIRSHRINRPLLFTSSSLGDHLVQPPRHALFEHMVVGAHDPFDAQSRFHRHQWPQARQISVHMQRDDAATVSRTTIDLSSRTMRVHYEALPTACGSSASHAA